MATGSRCARPVPAWRAWPWVREGIAQGAIVIEYNGDGHKQLGAMAHTGGLRQPTQANPQHANGVNLNHLGFADPTRPGQGQCVDRLWVSGAAVR